MQTSAESLPPLHRVAPRYLKLVTPTYFWSFMLISALMLFVLFVMIFLFSVLNSIPYAVALSSSLLMMSWSSPALLLDRCRRQIVGYIWAFHQWRWMCGGHGVFPAWSSLGTSWTGWVRVNIPDGLLLLSWRIPLADCSRWLHCWNSHIVPEWLELALPLCWSFWGPAQACMPDSVKRLLEVYEIVKQIALVL